MSVYSCRRERERGGWTSMHRAWWDAEVARRGVIDYSKLVAGKDR
jgi:hypothetical protein